MRRENQQDRSKYSRRTILHSLGSSSTLLGLGLVGTASAQSGSELIVTHKRGDKPVKTKRVPKSWKRHVDNASKAKGEIFRKHADRRDVKAISLSPVEDRYGGKRGFNIHVRVATNQAKRDLPDSSRGIRTIFSDYVKPEDHACYNNGDQDACPGGVTFNGGGTSGSQYFYDKDNDGYREPHILTAAHIFGDPCFNHLGDTATQTNDDWGTVEAHSGSLDAVVCSPNSGFSVDNRIIEQNDTKQVAGHVSEYGLKDMCANNEYVYKTGKETGTDFGPVQECEVTTAGCDDLRGEGVHYSLDSSGGDSGGPVYDIDGDDAYMVAIHKGAWNKYDTDCEGDSVKSESVGPSAYEINNAFGGAFVQGI